MSKYAVKADAVLQAIRECEVGDKVIIHNEKGMVWCIIKIVVKEHGEDCVLKVIHPK